MTEIMFKYGMSRIKWGHTLNDNRFQVMSLQEPPSQISFIIKQISGENHLSLHWDILYLIPLDESQQFGDIPQYLKFPAECRFNL